MRLTRLMETQRDGDLSQSLTGSAGRLQEPHQDWESEGYPHSLTAVTPCPAEP